MIEIGFLLTVLAIITISFIFGKKNASIKAELKNEKDLNLQQQRLLKSFSKTIEEVHEIHNFKKRLQKAIDSNSSVQLNSLYQEAINKKR